MQPIPLIMKATLEFNLPEEKNEHLYALKAVDALLVIDVLIELKQDRQLPELL